MRPFSRTAPVPRCSASAGGLRVRALVALAALIVSFSVVAVQLLRRGLDGGTPRTRIATIAAPPPTGRARPDIVDRNGRLLATDRSVSSLYADPHVLLDLD